MTIDRRSLLGMMGAGAAWPADAVATPATAVSFAHGVASGDPTPMGAVLWTRVTSGDADHSAPITVEWHVAEGERVVASGRTEARASRDWTGKVEPATLRPGVE